MHRLICCLVQWQLSSAKAVLEQRALDSITLDTTQGSRGQELTTLTVVCKEEDGDQIAAALLQVCLCGGTGIGARGWWGS